MKLKPLSRLVFIAAGAVLSLGSFTPDANATIIEWDDLNIISDAGNASDGLRYLDMSYGRGLTHAAALANAQGTSIELAVPEATPEEKKTLLRLLGAELIEVEDELCPLFPTEGARGVVKSMVESTAFNGQYVSPNQYENELNVDAHYHTTGPEIWNQTGGDIDYFFAAFGTCGTITGVGRYLKERNPDIKIIGIEPASRNHRLSGIKKISDLPDEFKPKILDYSLIDDIIAVEDRDAFEAGIQLARTEGIMVGPTTGALLHAAKQFGVSAKGRAVVISPDGAAKYVSAYAQYLEDD